MEDILVSINCITYNHEKYIAEAIESFLMQRTNFKFEILIHDDASTDRTQEIIKEYKKKYPDIIKTILREENQYSKGVKRIGYLNNHKRAKGKYIAWCEGDDYWTDPYKLQKQVDYLEANEECTMIFHNAEEINDVTKRSEGYMIPLSVPSKRCNIGELLGFKFIPTASTMYRKYTLDDPPKWYLNAIVGDLPGNLISTSYGYAYYINEVMSVYRVGNMNSAVNQWIIKQNNINAKIKHCDGFIEILNNFNEFSKYKYNNEIEDAKIYWDFQKEKLKGNIKCIKSGKYKEIYERLSFKSKLVVYLIKYFPNIYIKLNILKFKYRKLIQRNMRKNE